MNRRGTDVFRKVIIAAAVTTFMAGCTTTSTNRTVSAIDKSESRVGQILRAANEKRGEDGPVSRERSVYLGSKSVPFKADVALPRPFLVETDFRYPGSKFTLAQATAIISNVSGIPIRIAQDVYSGAGTQTASAAAPAGGSRLPSPIPNMGGATASTDSLNNITMFATATPAGMLDQICRMTGLNWEFRDGIAVIQRYVTRSFPLKVQPGSTSFDFSIGKTGSGQAAATSGGISAGFTSQSSIQKKSGVVSAMASVETMIKGVLSPAGKVIPSLASGTVTVIDTIDGIERAAKIMDRENEILTRKAVVHVQVLSFREKDGDQASIDWSLVFNNLNKLGATISSPQTLANQDGGQMGLQVLRGRGGPGKFDGSTLFASLLHEYGQVSTVYDSNVPTRNRMVTPVQKLTQTSYLAKTTPAPASATGVAGGVPGLEPGVVTTGFDMQLQPNILDSNQVSLLFTLGVVDLTRIEKITSGVGANQFSIEAPETEAFQFQSDLFLNPGETALLTGYERTFNAYTKRKLGREIPLFAGGSFDGSSTKEKIFILVTPVIVGNAY